MFGLRNSSCSHSALPSTSVLSSLCWINGVCSPAGPGISSHGGQGEGAKKTSYFVPPCGNFSIEWRQQKNGVSRMALGRNVSSQTYKSTKEFANVKQVTVAWQQAWAGRGNVWALVWVSVCRNHWHTKSPGSNFQTLTQRKMLNKCALLAFDW